MRRLLARSRDLIPFVRSRSPLSLALAALRRIRSWAWSRDVMTVYRLDRERFGETPQPFRVARTGSHWDSVEDFALYTGSDWRLSRAAIVAEARRRLADGEHSFTVVEEGILAHYHWLQLGRPEITFPEVGARYAVPPQSAISYGAYTEPRLRGRGLHRLSARETVHTAFALGAGQIFSGVIETNRASRRAVEGAGYRPVARIVCVRRLGRRRVRVDST
jgi:RimJ/RimL family protein N-acetyltransferase